MHYISIKRGRLVGENGGIVDTELMAEVKPSLHSVSGLCHVLKHDDFGDGIFFAKQVVHFICVSVRDPVREST